MTASSALYHACPPWLFCMFVPSDTNINYPLLQQSSVPPSLRKYWWQISRRLPIKYFSIAGSEVGCMLEHLLPTPTSSLSNPVRLSFWSNSSLVSRRDSSMTTAYLLAFQVAAVPFVRGEILAALLVWILTAALMPSFLDVMRDLLEWRPCHSWTSVCSGPRNPNLSPSSWYPTSNLVL